MSLKLRIKDIFSKFEDLLFSNHGCLSCRREIVDGTDYSLCKDCNENLTRIKGNICGICGEKILEDNSFCDLCKGKEYDFDKSRSFSVYEGVSARIIKRFKYNGKKYYAKYIAKLMLENSNYFDNIDFITYVPIGKKRRRERGFNQEEEMALEIGKSLNIPVLDCLEKVGSERHQAGLSQNDRMKNLKGTFMLKADAKANLKEKTIMIIDDVFTTGTTLSECAKALKQSRGNKPKNILCYTFAKTRFNLSNNRQNQQKNQSLEEIKVN